MQKNGIEYKFSNDAAFQISSSQNENDLFLIVILPHPLTIVNSNDILKYYLNPTESGKKDAIKNLNESFPRNKTAFSQFAWMFIDVNSIGAKKRVIPPSFFVAEKPILESNIIQLMSDASLSKFKQIQATILFNICMHSNNIILPKLTVKPQPFLALIHQLIVSLDSAGINTSFVSGRSILIKIQLKTNESADPIQCFYSPLSPVAPLPDAYSSCFYHEKTPQYNDNFVLYLPFPLSESTYLYFEVVHVHAKKSDT
jgi:hypothetical protein